MIDDEAPPTAPFSIRPARPRDARAVRELFAAVAAEGRWIRTERVVRSTGEFRRRARDAWSYEGAFLVAEADGRIVGNLRIAREGQEATRHVASFGMHVARDWRGRGVGTALLVEALRWARAVGVRKVELAVYPDNEAARALYARMGFVEEGRLLRHSRLSSGYRDEVLMGLWLGDA